jgi:hypothetical protein
LSHFKEIHSVTKTIYGPIGPILKNLGIWCDDCISVAKETLYKIAKSLKSQFKSENLEEIKEEFSDFITVWNELFLNKLIFKRPHSLFEHVTNFLICYEMYGKINEEEGFTNLHPPKLHGWKNLVKSVVSSDQHSKAFDQ